MFQEGSLFTNIYHIVTILLSRNKSISKINPDHFWHFGRIRTKSGIPDHIGPTVNEIIKLLNRQLTLPEDFTPFIRQAKQMTQESARQPTSRQFMPPSL